MLKRLWHVYEALAMVLGLGLLALICMFWTPFALLALWMLPPASGRRLGRAAIRSGFRLYLRLLQMLCACRFDLSELDALASEPGPMVVVANHPSLLDAVILASRLPNAVCIMKAALMQNFLLGAGARLACYIVNDAPLPMIRHAVRELKDGAKLIIFPESTRTISPPVDACSATAGVLAARSGAPVQALLIEMSSLYLGKHWPVWRPPALPLTVRVRRGQRWEPGVPAGDFGKHIEAYFHSALAPDLAPPPTSGTRHTRLTEPSLDRETQG